MYVFLGIALALSALCFGYPAWRISLWLGAGTSAALIAGFLATSFWTFIRLLTRRLHGRAAYAVRAIADNWLGLAPALLLATLLSEGVLLLDLMTPAATAVGALVGVVATAVWGVIRAWRPDIEHVAIESKKLNEPVRFAQISDVHIGSRTPRFLDQVIRQVESLEPDFLCITGDLIDQTGISEQDLDALRRFERPIFFCAGNHERYEDYDEILARLERLGVEILHRRSIMHGELQILGFLDSDSPTHLARELPTQTLDSSKFILLLYHRPHGLEDAAAHGVDLKISGHTHNGQIKPFNLAVKAQFRYIQGLYRHDDTHLYVNEGTGTWGPTMRLGTRSEITLFTLNPASG